MITHELSHDKRLRTVTISGEVPAQEFFDYRLEIVSQGNAKQIATFVDVSDLKSLDVGFALMKQHSAAVEQLNSIRPDGFTEIIHAPTDLGFGFARMYQTLADGRFSVFIFRDEAEAKKALDKVLSVSRDDLS